MAPSAITPGVTILRVIRCGNDTATVYKRYATEERPRYWAETASGQRLGIDRVYPSDADRDARSYITAVRAAHA